MKRGNFLSRLLRLRHDRTRTGTDIRDDLLLRMLLRHSPDEIYFKDRDSRFVRVSVATAKRFGLDDPDDIVGKWDLDFFSQESGEEYREAERVMIEGGDPLIDEEQEEIWADGHVTWVSCTKMPLQGPDGEVIGIFGLQRDITQRKRAEAELKRQQGRMATVIAAQHDVAVGDGNLSEALRITTERARELSLADGALLVLVEGEELVVNAACGGAAELLHQRFPAAGGVLAECIAGGKELLRSGALEIPGVGTQEVAAVPIRQDDDVVGVLAVLADDPQRFEPADLGSLALLAVVATAALGRDALRRHAEQSEYQALHDGLTGLPNRTLFKDRIQQALLRTEREGGRLAVMLMDLDRFKEINDTLGHASGDHVLMEVATRLHESLRASDTVARLGGDEFGIVLPQQNEASEIVSLLEKLTAAIEVPIDLDGLPLGIESSIGVAFYPDDGRGVEDLVKRADVAMYTAKQANRPYAFYEHTEETHDPIRLTLVGELRKAIEARELVLHYQPKAVLADRSVRSVEALVRWEHPERGLIPPDEFIPQAQETGLMKPLTLYVLEEALLQLRGWLDAGLDLAVAVNVATRNLIDTSFPDDLDALLARVGVPAERLELEITETAVLDDPFRTKIVLDRLHELGVRLSIDDFGTGYASLAYLRDLPVSEIKIDRSFVMNMSASEGDAVVVRATIDLGRNLGLDVVAEGIESEERWEELAALGCDAGQGYFLTRPIPAGEMLAWLEEHGHVSHHPV